MSRMVLADAGHLSRFNHHRYFLKFYDMALTTIRSRTFRDLAKPSKYGNARLSQTYEWWFKLLYCCTPIVFETDLSSTLQKINATPILRRKASAAIAARMARNEHTAAKTSETYGCVTNLSPIDEGIVFRLLISLVFSMFKGGHSFVGLSVPVDPEQFERNAGGTGH